MMEMDSMDLEKVAGGKVVETKEGKFAIIAPRAKLFDTKEEAEKIQTQIKEKLKESRKAYRNKKKVAPAVPNPDGALGGIF